jgi:hypothetical protein
VFGLLCFLVKKNPTARIKPHIAAAATHSTRFSPGPHGCRRGRVRRGDRRCVIHRARLESRPSSRRTTRTTKSIKLSNRSLSPSLVRDARAGVPRRTAVAAAAGVGAVGSLTTLALAYREPLNRCRCGRRKDEDEDEDEDAERASASRPRAFWPRAHCARCRKRTPAGVAMSFLFSPAYVAVASGVTALAAHVVGTKSIRAARAAASAVSRLVARRRPSS